MSEAGYRHSGIGRELLVFAGGRCDMPPLLIQGEGHGLMHCFRYVSCPVADIVPPGFFYAIRRGVAPRSQAA